MTLMLKTKAGDTEKVGGTHSKEEGSRGLCGENPELLKVLAEKTGQRQAPGFTATDSDPLTPRTPENKICLDAKGKTGGKKFRKIPGKGLGVW